MLACTNFIALKLLLLIVWPIVISCYSIFVNDLLNNAHGSVYIDHNVGNYSELVELTQTNSLYVIADNRTKLLRLDLESLRLQSSLNLYHHPTTSCDNKALLPCQTSAEFTLLSKTRKGDQIWYCSLYQTAYENDAAPPNIDLSRCSVPDPNTLEPNARLVQWENAAFASLSLDQPTVHLTASDGYLYSTGRFFAHLHLHRVQMPNYEGHLNWTGFLTTPVSQDWIREPAKFFLLFETTNEVYAVLQETTEPPCESTVLDRNERAPENDGRPIARLLRVCKGDRGGLPFVNDDEFSTLSKATLDCSYRREKVVWNYQKSSQELVQEVLTYNQLSSVYWDSLDQLLYLSFTTSSESAPSAAVCVYSLQSIEKAFNHPEESLQNGNDDDLIKSGSTGKASSSNLCQLVNSNTLTAGQYEALTGKSRNQKLNLGHIKPESGQPLMIRPEPSQPVELSDPVKWTGLTVEHRSESVTILYLASSSLVEQFRIYRATAIPMVCPMDAKLFVGGGSDELIVNIQMSEQTSDPKLYILTTRRLIRIPTIGLVCKSLSSSRLCSPNLAPQCQWDGVRKTCQVDKDYPLDVDIQTGQVMACPSPSHLEKQLASEQTTADKQEWWSSVSSAAGAYKNANSKSEELPLVPCVDVELNLTCLCQPCLSCNRMQSIQLGTCTIAPQWSTWSEWSSCSGLCGEGVQLRSRRCDAPKPAWLHASSDGRMGKIGCPTRQGQQVSDLQVELKQCNNKPLCLMHGVEEPTFHQSIKPSNIGIGWSDWESQSCGGWGLATRRRQCWWLGDNSQLICLVVGPGSEESQLIYSDSCPYAAIYTDWTKWLGVSGDSHSNSQLTASQVVSFRFKCHLPGTADNGSLREGRIQMATRRCDSVTGECVNSKESRFIETSNTILYKSYNTERHDQTSWSVWTSWSTCPTNCLHPSAVTSPSSRLDNNGRLVYDDHGFTSKRRRRCLTRDKCPPSSEPEVEQKACPALPVCASGWTCWSEWSDCVGSSLSTTTDNQCQVKHDGQRQRRRSCLQTSPGDSRRDECQGLAKQIETCDWLEGDACGQASTTQSEWSEWSSWSECASEGHSNLVQSRNRQCVSTNPHSIFIVKRDGCGGRWEEYRTCSTDKLLTNKACLSMTASASTVYTATYVLCAALISLFTTLLITLGVVLAHYYYAVRDGCSRTSTQPSSPSQRSITSGHSDFDQPIEEDHQPAQWELTMRPTPNLKLRLPSIHFEGLDDDNRQGRHQHPASQYDSVISEEETGIFYPNQSSNWHRPQGGVGLQRTGNVQDLTGLFTQDPNPSEGRDRSLIDSQPPLDNLPPSMPLLPDLRQLYQQPQSSSENRRDSDQQLRELELRSSGGGDSTFNRQSGAMLERPTNPHLRERPRYSYDSEY